MTVFCDGMVVDVGKSTAVATIEDGVAVQGEGTVGADGEARGGGPLHGVVILELAVGDDLSGATILIGEDTVFESDDGVDGADGLGLRGDVVGVVEKGNLKGTGIILIAPVGRLSRDG